MITAQVVEAELMRATRLAERQVIGQAKFNGGDPAAVTSSGRHEHPFGRSSTKPDDFTVDLTTDLATVIIGVSCKIVFDNPTGRAELNSKVIEHEPHRQRHGGIAVTGWRCLRHNLVPRIAQSVRAAGIPVAAVRVVLNARRECSVGRVARNLS